MAKYLNKGTVKANLLLQIVTGQPLTSEQMQNVALQLESQLNSLPPFRILASKPRRVGMRVHLTEALQLVKME